MCKHIHTYIRPSAELTKTRAKRNLRNFNLSYVFCKDSYADK